MVRRADPSEAAKGIRRLLDKIDSGELTATAGTRARLEGAYIALGALSDEAPVPEDLFEGLQTLQEMDD